MDSMDRNTQGTIFRFSNILVTGHQVFPATIPTAAGQPAL